MLPENLKYYTYLSSRPTQIYSMAEILLTDQQSTHSVKWVHFMIDETI